MKIETIESKSILSKASGFIGDFDYTLNPYSGCAFGCTYCYAAFFARTDDLKADWGRWVQVKSNALDLLKKKRKKPLVDVSIYMSSVTDPYQPVEAKLGLTRALLEELAEYHRVHLVVQTRGPLVTRDIDLLKRFPFVRVNMSITTDDETVRRAFEPHCASINQRLDAIQAVHEAGINTCVTMTPMLPIQDPIGFAHRLKATGVPHFVAQEFHLGKTRFAAGTGDEARTLAQHYDWTPERCYQTIALMRTELPALRYGRAGFAPDWEKEIG